MYVNLNNLLTLPNIYILPVLLILKQASKKDVSEYLNDLDLEESIFRDIEELGYIKYIKGSKNQSLFQKMRLDKKGTDYLNKLDESDVEDQDIRIFDWLAEIYKKKDKQIGNGKKTKRLIASFREKSGIEKNSLAFLCNTFINDSDEQEWSFKLEYVFWKPKNLFQSKFVLEDSRLWAYYNKKKQYFDKKFKEFK